MRDYLFERIKVIEKKKTYEVIWKNERNSVLYHGEFTNKKDAEEYAEQLRADCRAIDKEQLKHKESNHNNNRVMTIDEIIANRNLFLPTGGTDKIDNRATPLRRLHGKIIEHAIGDGIAAIAAKLKEIPTTETSITSNISKKESNKSSKKRERSQLANRAPHIKHKNSVQ